MIALHQVCCDGLLSSIDAFSRTPYLVDSLGETKLVRREPGGGGSGRPWISYLGYGLSRVSLKYCIDFDHLGLKQMRYALCILVNIEV